MGTKCDCVVKMLIPWALLCQGDMIRHPPNRAENGPLYKSSENYDIAPNFFYRDRGKILYIVSESEKITLSVDFLSKREGQKRKQASTMGKGANHERIFEVVVGFDIFYEVFQVNAGKQAA